MEWACSHAPHRRIDREQERYKNEDKNDIKTKTLGYLCLGLTFWPAFRIPLTFPSPFLRYCFSNYLVKRTIPMQRVDPQTNGVLGNSFILHRVPACLAISGVPNVRKVSYSPFIRGCQTSSYSSSSFSEIILNFRLDHATHGSTLIQSPILPNK